MNKTPTPSHDVIANAIVGFVIENQVSDLDAGTLDRDQSLFDLQILDSFGILNLVTFLEETWSFQVADEDITLGNFSSINAIAGLVASKLG